MLQNNTPLSQMQMGMNRVSQLKPQVAQANIGNIAESPVLQSKQAGTAAQSPSAPLKPTSKRLSWKMMAGVAVLVLVILGSGAGLYLSQQIQDPRQQASTPTGTAVLSLTPTNTSFVANTKHTIDIKVNMGVSQINIDGIQFIAEITGTLPADIKFEPAAIEGLNPIATTLIDTANGKKLTVAMVTTPPTPFSATNKDLIVGKLTFTAPSTGSMSISFDPTASKILQNQTTDDVLRTPPSSITYTFSGGVGGGSLTLTPTPTNGVNQATSSADLNNSFESTQSATMSGQTSLTLTPTPTITVASETPTPTQAIASDSGRESSLPNQDHTQPVSGSVHMTLFLLAAGAISILSGAYLLKVEK